VPLFCSISHHINSIQLEINEKSYIGEVLFFMLLRINEATEPKPVAVVSLYGPPHPGLLAASSNTYWTARHLRDAGVKVVDTASIRSAVMMAPDERYKTRFQDGSEVDRWFLMDKPGLKLAECAGLEELLSEADD
jgi:hypothetical protein